MERAPRVTHLYAPVRGCRQILKHPCPRSAPFYEINRHTTAVRMQSLFYGDFHRA